MKTWKQRLAAVMAAVMLVSLLPVTALAEETGTLPEESPASSELGETPVNSEPEETPVGSELEDTPVKSAPEETSPANELEEPGLDIQELGVTVGGQYVAAAPVDELPPEELSPQEEELLVGIPAPASVLPITEHRNCTLDLQSFWPDQLKAVTLSVITGNLTGSSITTAPNTKIMWAKSNTSDWVGNDDFQIMGPDGTMDLTPVEPWRSYVYLHLIVGAADQFDTTNVRYLIRVWVPSVYELFNVFDAEMATVGNVTVPVFDTYGSYYSDDLRLQISVDEKSWTPGTGKLALSLKNSSSSQPGLSAGQTAAIYAGKYATAEAAEQSGNDITNSILGQTMPGGGYMADFSQEVPLTLVVKDSGGNVLQVLPFNIEVYGDGKYVDAYDLYTNAASRVSASNSRRWRDETEIFILKSGLSANDSYYLSLYFHNPGTNSGGTQGVNYVKAAYQGNYASEAAAMAAGAAEIKSQLFSNAYSSGGYLVNLKTPVTFTVVDTDDEVHHISVTVQETADQGEQLPPAPTPLSEDTYFRIESAFVNETDDGAGVSGARYNAYVMPFQHDSYYYNGYQTVFLLGTAGTSAVADGTTIYPEFYAGPKVTVHAGHTEVGEQVSTSQQKSGMNAVEFHSGQAIQYSAAAENTKSLKNYWVTFLTQQTNTTLFVNGVTNADEEHKEEDGTPIREIILDEAHEYHHDVFIANLGSTAMNDLTVTLSADAKNIQLDEYWKVDGTKSLDPFTTTATTTTAGGLSNMAKIRLLPLRDADGNIIPGEISGTLTITGGGQTVTVKLTGRSGRFTISTDRLVNGVKYVHYSSVIQTSNMYEADAVRFTLVEGPLPSGLTLRPSGEIYGVPTVTRAAPWHIKVRAAYTEPSGQVFTDEKEYDLTVIDNTDANVWNATDTNYHLLRAIVNEDNTVSLPQGHVPVTDLSEGNSWSGNAQTFWSNGEYGNFQVTEVRLDSTQLIRGRDYTDEAGSTKITIQNQTLRSRGNGTHTISVEFREGGTNGILKRTAQNYTLTSLGNQSSGGGSGGGSGGNSSGGSSSTSQKPTKPVNPTTPATKPTFEDVPMNHTFYDDVEWSYDNGLMQGITTRRFAPRNAITQATVVTVLARIANVDLSRYENDGSYPTIPAGAWYTNAAVWATQAGLLPNNTSFNSEGPISRADMAIMLVKYLESMGIDVSVPEKPVIFADASQMSQEANDAFQVLYRCGIFRGFGDNMMGPNETTTRAQFAALIHRMSVLIEG